MIPEKPLLTNILVLILILTFIGTLINSLDFFLSRNTKKKIVDFIDWFTLVLSDFNPWSYFLKKLKRKTFAFFVSALLSILCVVVCYYFLKGVEDIFLEDEFIFTNFQKILLIFSVIYYLMIFISGSFKISSIQETTSFIDIFFCISYFTLGTIGIYISIFTNFNEIILTNLIKSNGIKIGIFYSYLCVSWVKDLLLIVSEVIFAFFVLVILSFVVSIHGIIKFLLFLLWRITQYEEGYIKGVITVIGIVISSILAYLIYRNGYY